MRNEELTMQKTGLPRRKDPFRAYFTLMVISNSPALTEEPSEMNT